jgi:parvulin-like peptidyl-prolyl isomerase
MINGQPITRSLFSSELHARREGNTESLPSDAMTWLQLKAAFLDQMVNRLLLEQEAVRRQVTVVDADVDSALEMIKADWPQGSFESVLADRQISIERFRQEIRHNLLTEMMAKKVVSPNIEITEQDIQSFYRQNPELFSHPEQVRARQILIRTEAEAAEILTRILTGTSFIDMARAHSIAPEAQKGGDLGYFGRGQMPRVVEDACFALDVRQTSDIIKSDYGYHLFFIENRRAAAVTPLNNARAEIVGKLREEKLDAAWPAFIASLKASAQIEINEPMLASIKQDEI